MSATSLPFQDAEAAEPAGVSEGLRFADAAAGFHRLEVADGGPHLPDLPGFGDEVVEAVSPQEVGLAAIAGRRWQLVDRHLGGDVLAPGIMERVAAGRVQLV